MDLVTPTIVFILMLASWFWGKSQGYRDGTAHGAMALFWWFEDKAGTVTVEGWIDSEPDTDLQGSLMKINKYKNSDKIIALVIRRKEDEDE